MPKKKPYPVYFRWKVENECNHWKIWGNYKTKSAAENAVKSLKTRQWIEFTTEDKGD